MLRSARRTVVLGAALWLAVLGAPLPPAAATSPAPSHGVAAFGTSTRGRPIRLAYRCGTGAAPFDAATTTVLVVGVIHGTETAGLPVVAGLGRSTPPAGTCWWLLAALNPDGRAHGTRQNARGVDLNRNFPFDWRRAAMSGADADAPFDTYFPGRARASELETRAALRMVRRLHPDVTIWYHQHLDIVVRPPLPWRQRLAATYARAAGMSVRIYPGRALHGTAAAWQHAEQPASLALVVELPTGSLAPTALVRHVAAVRAITRAARSRAAR